MQVILACRSTASCRLWTYDCDMTTDALFAWLGVRLSAFLWFLLRIPAEETCTEDPFVVVVVAAVCGTSSLACRLAFPFFDCKSAPYTSCANMENVFSGEH